MPPLFGPSTLVLTSPVKANDLGNAFIRDHSEQVGLQIVERHSGRVFEAFSDGTKIVDLLFGWAATRLCINTELFLLRLRLSLIWVIVAIPNLFPNFSLMVRVGLIKSGGLVVHSDLGRKVQSLGPRDFMKNLRTFVIDGALHELPILSGAFISPFAFVVTHPML